MELTVRLFGPLARAARRGAVTIECGGASVTVAELGRIIQEREPSLAPMMNICRFAVNSEFASGDQAVGPDDEIALIGLVSGG